MTTKPEMTIEQARRVVECVDRVGDLNCVDCTRMNDTCGSLCGAVVLEAARMVYSSERREFIIPELATCASDNNLDFAPKLDRNEIANGYIKSMYANPKCWDEPTEAILDVAFDLADQFIAMAEGGDGNETN